jgi:hypothetical protein
MASTDPRTFVHACIERALWEVDANAGDADWPGSLIGDFGKFTGRRDELYELDLADLGSAFGNDTSDPAAVRARVQAYADTLGLGPLRTLAELRAAARG